MNTEHKGVPKFQKTEYSKILFSSRKDAGISLAKYLKPYLDKNTLVVGISSGGTCVASEIAKKFKLPMDVLVSRKLHVPHDENISFGAVAPGDVVVIDDMITRFFNISEIAIDTIVEQEIARMKNKSILFECTPDRRKPKNKTIFLIDDEVVTGMTMHAAIISVKISYKPSKIIVAVPIGSRNAIAELGKMVDTIICIDQPVQAMSIHDWYKKYPHVTDQEVKQYMESQKKSLV